MLLRSSPASPFGRKVRMAAIILGLDRRIEITKADTTDPADTVRKENPLGKIPALVLDDGEVLYDSRVIVEYLEHLAGGGRIVPSAAKARADGILEAAILQVYEGRWRDASKHEPKWVEHQAGKVTRALAALEAAPPGRDATPNIGQIAVACVLGYRDFRFAGTWRKDHPRLVKFLDEFAAAVPAFAATAPD